MGVKMKKLGLIFLILVFIFIGCGNKAESPFSPEIKPRAVLTISMQYEPVAFIYNAWLASWCIDNCIILVETNGVGGNINFMKAEMMYQGLVGETKNFAENYNFNARESMSGCDFDCTIYEYDEMKVTVQGTDNNGYAINVSRTFDVYYQ